MEDLELHREVDEIRKTQIYIEKKIDKILNAMFGDNDNALNIGVVHEIGALKDKVKKLETWRDRALYILIGISAAAGWGVGDIIKTLFK
jgi:hypothetical protein